MQASNVGTVLVLAAIWRLLALTQAAGAEEYVGSKSCKRCHADMHAEIVRAYEMSLHARSFADVAETPAAILARFTPDAPVQKEQIKYVIGAGKKRQAYLDANLRVLPAQWSVPDRTWEKVTPADGAKQCIGCHTTGYNTTSKTWEEPGVGCEGCHGMGSDHSVGGDATKITNPKLLPKDRQAMICGQCHSKGTDKTGLYAFVPDFRPGDDLSKLFVVGEPEPGGMNQEYSEMLGNKHLSAGIICTTCHEPHGVEATGSAQLRKPITELCQSCHNRSTDMSAHLFGAADVSFFCGKCHTSGGPHLFRK